MKVLGIAGLLAAELASRVPTSTGIDFAREDDQQEPRRPVRPHIGKKQIAKALKRIQERTP